MTLQQDGRGDPLADQLEQPAGLVEGQHVLGTDVSPPPDLADPQDRGVDVPVGGLDLLPRDPDPGDVDRVARARHHVAAHSGRPGEHLLPRERRGRRDGGGRSCAADDLVAQRTRRCCSSATSSPNIRLYSVACSTGLVRWSLDFTSAIRRLRGQLLQAGARARRRRPRRARAPSTSASTPSAEIADETTGSSGRVAQPRAPVGGGRGRPAGLGDQVPDGTVRRVLEVVGTDLGRGPADQSAAAGSPA